MFLRTPHPSVTVKNTISLISLIATVQIRPRPPINVIFWAKGNWFEIDLPICLSLLLNTVSLIDTWWNQLVEGPSPHTYCVKGFVARCLVGSNIKCQRSNSKTDSEKVFVYTEIWTQISRTSNGLMSMGKIKKVANQRANYSSRNLSLEGVLVWAWWEIVMRLRSLLIWNC